MPSCRWGSSDRPWIMPAAGSHMHDRMAEEGGDGSVMNENEANLVVKQVNAFVSWLWLMHTYSYPVRADRLIDTSQVDAGLLPDEIMVLSPCKIATAAIWATRSRTIVQLTRKVQLTTRYWGLLNQNHRFGSSVFDLIVTEALISYLSHRIDWFLSRWAMFWNQETGVWYITFDSTSLPVYCDQPNKIKSRSWERGCDLITMSK